MWLSSFQNCLFKVRPVWAEVFQACLTLVKRCSCSVGMKAGFGDCGRKIFNVTHVDK
jgi:hypothetical protein